MMTFKQILCEIGINKPAFNLQLGKFKHINKSTKGQAEVFSWDNALQKKILSSITKRNAEQFFGILGVKPERVIVEHSERARNSYYITAKVDGEPIMLSRRETQSPMAGQTLVYSRYAKIQLHNIMGHTDWEKYIDFLKTLPQNLSPNKRESERRKAKNMFYIHNSKNNILALLKIPGYNDNI